MDLYQRPEFTPTHTNCYTIGVSNDLDSWLTETNRVLEVTGTPQHEIFNRWDRAIEELDSTSPGVTKHSYEDISITIRGRHPIFQRITLDGPVSVNAYIGEIKGHVGRKEQYQQESANRWHELRHPEPFVFFHDKLPIYIDSRVEGTILRYVRRSCQPNTKIQIIIHGREFHFCLISTKDIDAGEEITLGWSLDEQINEIVKVMLSTMLTCIRMLTTFSRKWLPIAETSMRKTKLIWKIGYLASLRILVDALVDGRKAHVPSLASTFVCIPILLAPMDKV